MDYRHLNDLFGHIDIYLLDQILKGRFEGLNKILDAGCGEGRNSRYLVSQNKDVHFLDKDPVAIKMARMIFKTIPAGNFHVGGIDSLPFDDSEFDAVICSAVLHFAKDRAEFLQFWEEISRVIRENGFLFVRMSSQVGLSGPPPEFFSYSLSEEDIAMIGERFIWMDPFKTVRVEDRSMSVLALQKRS